MTGFRNLAGTALLALLLAGGVSCRPAEQGGAAGARSEGDAPPPTAAGAPGQRSGEPPPRQAQPAPAPPSPTGERPPELLYVKVAPELSEETPVVEQRLPASPGREPYLRNDTLYAAAGDLVAVLRPGARVSLRNGRVLVDGRQAPFGGVERGGAVYVPVKAFAREFGAYVRVNPVDGSATLWPREALLYWREHGDPRAPVLREAVEEGLIPPP